MSENLNIRSTLTAVNEASPVIRNVIADLKKLERVGKSFNAAFANLGRGGITSLDGFSRAAKSAAAEMHGIANTARSASRSYSESWTRATEHRLNENRRLYAQLDRMEATYRQQIERTAAAERRAVRGGGIGRGGIGSGRLPVPGLRSLAIGGVIGGAGIASALKKRIEVQAAEVRSQMFGDLSETETEALRKSFADKAGIRYGIGTSKALDAATEGLKAGIAKQFAGEFGDLALKAQAGLDVPSEDVAKLLGRLATQMPWSKDRFSKVLNAVAIANRDTASSGSEIVEATRRSLSALVSTRMSPEQLAAINGTNISLGVQPFKAGTFLSFLTSQVAGANSARWNTQQAKDLRSASMALGFGGRDGIAQAMRDNPVETYLKILDQLAQMPEVLRTKVAKQLGGREWMDELLTAVLGRDKLREVLKDISKNSGFLDKVALQKIGSMQGRWASIAAAFGLVWEKIGGGMETAFDQISDAILDLADRFNFDSVKDHFGAFVDGLREGFGLKSWGHAVKALTSEFDAGTIAKWRSFGKGFAGGMREFGESLATAFKAIRIIAGSSNDPEGLGRLTAKLTGLVVTLALLSPLLSALSIFSGLMFTLASLNPFARLALGLTALAFGIKRVLDFVADKLFAVFVSIVDSIKNVALSIINTVRGWIGLATLGGSHGASGSWTEGSTGGASGGWSPTSQKAAQSFNSPGATPASYAGSGLNSDAYGKMFAGTVLAGKSAQIAAAAKSNGIPPELLGAVIAHETGRGRNVRFNNVAGLLNPETGFRTKQGFASLDDGINAAARTVAKSYRAAGGDLEKMGDRYAPIGAANDPSGLNKNWPTAVAGYQRQLSSSGIMGKDPVAVASQFIGKNEYRDRADLTNFVKHDVIGSANAWCSRFVNASLREAGIIGSGSAVANSFQRWGTGINPANVSRGDVALQPNGRGPDQPGGHVGLATGRTRMVNGQLQLEMLSGNDGDSVKTSWRNANRLMIRRPSIQNVPPAEAVKNVPGVIPNGDASLGGGGRNGNVAIHINGGSHDPEALALLVQRRIDESMNWRTHESESEYT
ncbi:TP901 family phage tail tape measure protein [Nitrobacter vulgaris]|uniref:phage tail tape measure protein n=1 Tax=Nitrobacter vulgaris TaxID=29421 RepID=UPI00285A0DB8|nr:phage tail tape measure protein [Nitrobacter vulgaris]MDR6305947.1 TP901 family phage tail tape measure protein [Nitrobacter vulgaris]